jgi:hypothetical protein
LSGGHQQSQHHCGLADSCFTAACALVARTITPETSSTAMPKRTASRQNRGVEIVFAAITAETPCYIPHLGADSGAVPPPERGTPG